MKLTKIIVENFRQFYGEQTVEFSTGEKNITIILGENGKGKTGLFRALVFGLFGIRYLEQDDKKEQIHLVNFIRLEENKNKVVTAKVTVEFEHKNKNYKIIRIINGIKTGKKIEERLGQNELYVVDEYGNFSAEPIIDDIEIDNIITSVIEKKTKDFFFFDAEKIETLTKTEAKTKDEIKAGIVKLLQIDKLEDGISILRSLIQKEKKILSDRANNINLKKIESKIDSIKLELNSYQEKIEIKEEEKHLCHKEIADKEAILAKNEEIRVYTEKINDKIEHKKDKMHTLKSLKENLKSEHLNQGHMFIIQDSFLSTQTYLEQIFAEQKDLISIEVIEKSLKEMICNCCKTDLKKVVEAYEAVLQAKEDYKRSEMTPLITDIKGTIREFTNVREASITAMKKKLNEIREIKDEISEVDRSIEVLRNKIKDSNNNESNFKAIEETIDEHIKKLGLIEEEIHRALVTIELKTKELEQLEREYSKLFEQDAVLRKDHEKIKHLESIMKELQLIFEDYTGDMRNNLMFETTSIFKTLIDRKDKDLIDKININERYEIEAYNWAETKITQDLSQGQKQVLALSFITALAKVASSGNTSVDFPLFMDTPFGRISGNNRDNLIENIPKLTSQWIPLLTDTEFTINEEIKFKSGNKLGKCYKLEQEKTGVTKIIEVSADEQLSKRGRM